MNEEYNYGKKNNYFSELCLKTVRDVRNRNSVSGPNFRTGLFNCMMRAQARTQGKRVLAHPSP